MTERKAMIIYARLHKLWALGVFERLSTFKEEGVPRYAVIRDLYDPDKRVLWSGAMNKDREWIIWWRDEEQRVVPWPLYVVDLDMTESPFLPYVVKSPKPNLLGGPDAADDGYWI